LALGEVALPVPFVSEPLLDDIGCGRMEGALVQRDHTWRSGRGRDQRPAGGESIREAALRIAAALRTVSSRPEEVIVVVTHELVVRYALNATADNEDISSPWREIPNATPFVLEREAMARAAERIEVLALGPWGKAVPGVRANGG
jgi:broad specificity phosphatase PhoE